MTRILITGGRGNIAQIIVRHLYNKYHIDSPSRTECNILDPHSISNYLDTNEPYDVLLHTAIKGGRRTKEETGEVTHVNLVMFENLMVHAHRFQMILNLDSGAIYDRSTDIRERKETDICTVPQDYYGFSKYVIYQRSLSIANVLHFRIFNIFHSHEEPDRFISLCLQRREDGRLLTIHEDKYFDFVHERDFAAIFDHYVEQLVSGQMHKLPKVVNISYGGDKLKLSDIARLILKRPIISILTPYDETTTRNYSGDGRLLQSMHIPGLRGSLTQTLQEEYDSKI